MTSVLIVDDQATNRLLLSKLASSIANDVQVAAFEDPAGANARYSRALAKHQFGLLPSDRQGRIEACRAARGNVRRQERHAREE